MSWRYYVFEGDEPDCEDDEAMTCAPVKQGSKTYSIWDPLIDFTDVKEDGQLSNVQSLTNFYSAVKNTMGSPCWDRHRSVKAAIVVQATGAGGRREAYQVTVVLTWR